MIIEVKAGVRASNKEPRAIVLDKMIKVSSTSSTHDDREPETNRGRDLGVDDKTDFNRPPIVHSRTSIVHSRTSIVHSQNLYRAEIRVLVWTIN
jgi:hypothetical protein